MTLLTALHHAIQASTFEKGVGWTIPPKQWVAVLAAFQREKEQRAIEEVERG